MKMLKFFLTKLFILSFVLSGTAFADLNQILDSGKVRIAVPESFAPFGSLGADGEHEGFDVDVAKLIAEDLKEYYRIPADNRDLNYDKYFFDGMKNNLKTEEYSSYNTERISNKELINLLSSIGYK